MKKILIKIEDSDLSFSEYKRTIDDANLNNTNIIDVKNLKFTDEYILENLDLVSMFLNLVVLKFKLKKVIIKNMTIASVALKILKNIDNIKEVKFKEDIELSYIISLLLLENNNLEKIECYNLPEIMFYRFDKDKIKTRSEFVSSSNFFNNNNIKTHSELYNKEKIIIDEFLTKEDIDDIIYFFSSNVNLKKIEFKRYSRQNLITILNMVKQNGLKKVKIILWENELTTNDILLDIKLFEKLNKKYNVNIKIKYSKKYKDKNKVKELNLVLLKISIITLFILGVVLLVSYKLIEKKDNKKVEELNEIINEVINDTKIPLDDESVDNTDDSIYEVDDEYVEENNYINPYYKDYSKYYNDLLELNSDTIGWISVNNTKINYPVVQSQDNNYYLDKAFDKTRNTAGWLFVDYRNNMDYIDKNTIIYGHGLFRNGVMFSTLKNVLNENWYTNSQNLDIIFSIKEKKYTWKIFSIYTIDVTNDYLYTDFTTDEEFIEFINLLSNRSIYNFNVEVTASDKILTLSTCYKDDKHRLVVHAKMM